MPSVRKHAFVTGATGFLGRNLVEQLAERGWKITAAYRRGDCFESLRHWDAAGVECDLLDPEGLTAAVPEGVDAVFHLAADLTMWARHGARQRRTNVEGTRNAVAAAERKGARRFVFTSSWNAWGHRPGDPPLTEDMPQRGDASPVLYDRTKLAGETIVRQAAAGGLPAVILNPCHIVGRYDSRSCGRMIRMVHQRTLPAILPGSDVFCHAGAVAAAHIAAAESDGATGNYLLPGPSASYVEVIHAIGRIAGRQVPKRVLPACLFRALAHVRNAVGNLRGTEPDLTPQAAHIVLTHRRVASDKAQRELGYRSPGLETMLRDCYDWMRRAGVLDG